MKKTSLLIMFIIFIAKLSFAQITPIHNIQHDGTTGVVTVQGIVCATDVFQETWIADAAGTYNGIVIYDATISTTYVAGDLIQVTGSVQEYFNMTEISSVTANSIVSSGNPLYPATVITCTDLDMATPADTLPAEQYEGCLVRIENAKCITAQEMANYEATVSDDSSVHTTIIDDDVAYHLIFGMSVGAIYDITGVVQYKYAAYKLCPRNASDIIFKSPDVNDWAIY